MNKGKGKDKTGKSRIKGTTFEEFVAQAQPFLWKERNSMRLDEWFRWPPDIFALTSLLLSYTGAYRTGFSPPTNQPWPKHNWVSTAQKFGHDWREWVSGGYVTNFPLLTYRDNLEELKDVEIDSLYDCTGGEPWELCKNLLELHGIADEAMRGVGIIFNPRTTLKITSPENSQFGDKLSMFYLKANFLLAVRGSLSRIPKYRGVVIPKSRTPQVGFTMRSFSNNITFHQTEVDVVWRTFPWFNFDENTINIMIIPWPFEVNANFFSPVYNPKASNQVGSDRYFHYEPKAEKGLDPDKLLRIIKTAKREARRIHMLVFPEMALRRIELKNLKRYLEAHMMPHDMPMIVSGVSEPFEIEEDNELQNELTSSDPSNIQTRSNFQASHQAAGYNRTVLSVYFAGKWHDVVQDKHHRWKIDSSQIEQYKLGGVLSGVRTWWEAIQIKRRRLSVLAANSWLTICPLICEDLARLEPVSELIRGVGPTLLTALLLDGPQLKERWSARYASVLADDPGTSVLTLTSLGMSKRSVIPGGFDHKSAKKANDNSYVVGFWKDQEKGWHNLVADRNSDFPTTVLTISALWKNETAFDGRIDHENAAVFAYQGLFQGNDNPEIENVPIGKMAHKEKLSSSKEKKEVDAKRKKLTVLDMCELTLFTYYTDAIVDTKSDPLELHKWFRHAVGNEDYNLNSNCQTNNEILQLLVYSIDTRDLVPREVPTPHLMIAIEKITELVVEAQSNFMKEKHNKDRSENFMDYWNVLKNISANKIREISEIMKLKITDPESEKYQKFESEMVSKTNWSKNYILLEKEKRLDRLNKTGNISEEIICFNPHEFGRLVLSIPLSILWSLHARLSTRRRYGVLNHKGATLLKEIEEEINNEEYHKNFLDWRYEMRG